MARNPFVMRSVIGWFQYRPAGEPKHSNGRPIEWPVDVLECGHVSRMPHDYRTVDRLKSAFQATGLQPIGKRRCYKCGK